MSRFFVSYNKLQNKLHEEIAVVEEADPLTNSDVDNFLLSIFRYVLYKFKSFLTYLYYSFFRLLEIVELTKDFLVKKMFWGRSPVYKIGLQGGIFIFTVLIALYNLTSILSVAYASENYDSYYNPSSDLIIRESASLKNIADSQSRKIISVETETYTVQQGDTLEKIAEKMAYKFADMYKEMIDIQVTPEMIKAKKDVIRYANNLIYENPVLKVGQQLQIYHFDGMVYQVKDGDNISSIAEKFKITIEDVVQINELEYSEDKSISLITNQVLLLPRPYIEPGKQYVAPVKATVTNVKTTNVSAATVSSTSNFPLDTSCNHGFSRGLQWSGNYMTHTGIDIWGSVGCKELAVWSGTVVVASYYCGACGNTVIIEHDNGTRAIYYHGNGTYYVKVGDRVVSGQAVQGLGSTGNSTGPHLHYELRVNGAIVNPLNYFSLQ